MTTKAIITFYCITRFCTGQFFYTGHQENDKLINQLTNKNFSYEDSLDIWQQYNKKKQIKYKNVHHFGLFLNIKNNSNSHIIHERPDLLGNGFLTNYAFSISNLEIMNSMFFTYDMNEAKRGFVRTIKNVTMYTNQAYLKINQNHNELNYFIKIGRDFLIEGFGKSAKIFFSDYSRPFDQITFAANYKNLNSKLSIISLNELNDFKRLLYLHIFDFKFKKFQIKIGEAAISSGFEESIDIKYLNPFNFWSWENVGSTVEGLNAFLYSGFYWKISSKLNFYGDILIDDINFHQNNAFYLNRYAYLLGIYQSSFLSDSSFIWLECSNVLNQVYQSYHPSHIFTHRNFPIGHYLGNDFINFRIHYSQILKSNKKFFFEFSHLIKGKNGLDTIFDNAWEDNEGNFIKNYKHPGYPTPPLNYINDSHFGVEIMLKDYSYLTFSLERQKTSDKEIVTKLRMRFWKYLNLIK